MHEHRVFAHAYNRAHNNIRHVTTGQLHQRMPHAVRKNSDARNRKGLYSHYSQMGVPHQFNPLTSAQLSSIYAPGAWMNAVVRIIVLCVVFLHFAGICSTCDVTHISLYNTYGWYAMNYNFMNNTTPNTHVLFSFIVILFKI